MNLSELYKEVIKNYWIDYIFILIVSFLLIGWSMSLFLVLALIFIIVKIDASTNFMRKYLRIMFLLNEVRMMAILKKLKINLDEIANDLEKQKDFMSEKDLKQLEKDFSDILGVPFKI